jgi:hypothetical protein
MKNIENNFLNLNLQQLKDLNQTLRRENSLLKLS